MSDSLITPEFAIWKLGGSAEGRVLDALAISPRNAGCLVPEAPARESWPWILFLGGVHGDEIEGVWLMEELRSRWAEYFPFEKCGVVVWPRVNPDGVARGVRWNSRDVDLNRNLATKDWTAEVKNPRYPPGPAPLSEPENRALVSLLEKIQPIAVLSAHSYSEPQVNANGPSRSWAEAWAPALGYPVTEDIGYPTPGSLGTYAGLERQIPVITLEIQRGLPRERVLELFCPAMNEAVRFWEK